MNKIIRQKVDKNFTIIPNVVFNTGLSLRAIGLLTYMLHLPDDWILYKTYLYKEMKEGRDAINAAWAELEEAGYITTEKGLSIGGKFPEIHHIVYNMPSKRAENPVSVSPHPESPHRETRPLLRTKKQSTIPLPKGNGAAVPADAGPAPKKKPPIEKKKPNTPLQKFIDVYDIWFKGINDGTPPKYDGAAINAAKMLLVYLRKIVSEKAAARGDQLGEDALEKAILETWGMVLGGWECLDNFMQAKTRLLDINSNIQNILTQIRRHAKSQSSDPNGSITDAYKKRHAGTARLLEQIHNDQGRTP